VVDAVPTALLLLTVRVNVPVPFWATVFVKGVFVIESSGSPVTVTVADAMCGPVGSPPPVTVAVFV
jgi:hypothetical protein